MANRAAKQQKRTALNAADTAVSTDKDFRARVRADARNAGAFDKEDVAPPDLATLPNWHPDAVQDRFLAAMADAPNDETPRMLALILRKVAHESRQGVSIDRALEIIAEEIDAEAEAANAEREQPEPEKKAEENIPEGTGNIPPIAPKT